MLLFQSIIHIPASETSNSQKREGDVTEKGNSVS